MRTSKAWLRAGDEYFLQRVARVAGKVVHPVVAAARPGQQLPSLSSEVEIAHDAVENAGPLAGLAAGFQALAGRCDAAFVASCDHPLLTAPFIHKLIDLLGERPGVIPDDGRGTFPLLAVYRLSAAATLTTMLRRGEHRVHDFARRCGADTVPGSVLAEVDPALVSLLNVNTQSDYDMFINRPD